MYTNPTNFSAAGIKQLHFSTWSDFELWKQTEEDATYTTYIKGQQTYCPQAEGKDAHNLYQHLIIVQCVLYRGPNTLLLQMLPRWEVPEEYPAQTDKCKETTSTGKQKD